MSKKLSKTISKSLMKLKDKKILIGLLISLLSIFLWTKYGLLKFPITPDMGKFLYGAQELLKGRMPYKNLFDPKTPLTFILPALGMFLFENLGLSNILAGRITTLICGATTIFFTFLLADELLENQLTAIVSSIILSSFPGFAWGSLSGRSKIFVACFGLISLYSLKKEKYFSAGFFSSLSGLTWQPGGVFIFPVLLYTFLKEKNNKKKSFWALSGIILPVILIISFFALNGALKELIYQTISFPLIHVSSRGETILRGKELFNILAFYGIRSIFFIFGLSGFFLIITKYKKIWKSKSFWLFFCLAFSLIFAYTCIDIQYWPDLLPLLPFIGVFCGYFFKETFNRLSKKPNRLHYVLLILILLPSLYLLTTRVMGNEIRGRYKTVRWKLKQENNFDKIDSLNKNNPRFYSLLIKELGIIKILKVIFIHPPSIASSLGEQIEVAKFVERNTDPDEKVLSFGASDILFISKRSGLTKHTQFGKLDIKYMHKKGDLINCQKKIKEEKPRLLVSRDKEIVNNSKTQAVGLSGFMRENYKLKKSTTHYSVFMLKNKG